MTSENSIVLVKEHEVFKYFYDYLEFPKQMALELTLDVIGVALQ